MARLEENVGGMEPVTAMLAKGMRLEDMCQRALAGFSMEVLDETRVNYACNCGKQRFGNVLLTLGGAEIRSLPLNGEGCAEAVCQYCGRKYYFSREELEQLAQKAETGKAEK